MENLEKGCVYRDSSDNVLQLFLQISLTKKELVTEAWMEEYESDDVTEAVKKVLEKEDGLYRTETRGTAEQNKAADNDILVPGQNVTSCYSSVTNPDYKAFRRRTSVKQAHKKSSYAGIIK